MRVDLPWPPRSRDEHPITLSSELGVQETFVGSWRNTLDRTNGIARVDIHMGDDRPSLQTLDQVGRCIDWGQEVEWLVDIAPGRPIAFSVEKDFGATTGLLQGNLNLNLLVLGTYRAPKDGGIGYFSREFFIREDAPAPSPLETSGELFAAVAPPSRLDTKTVEGHWLNTEDPTLGIQEILIADRTDRLDVKIVGSGDMPWGRAGVQLCAAVDEAGVKTFSVLADYQGDRWVSRLQLRPVGGALAVASFNTFDDSSHPSYFTREFVYRADS